MASAERVSEISSALRATTHQAGRRRDRVIVAALGADGRLDFGAAGSIDLRAGRATSPSGSDLIDAVDTARAVRPSGWGEVIIHVHESAHAQMGLGDVPPQDESAFPRLQTRGWRVSIIGSAGWLRVRFPNGDRPVHFAFPNWSGDFSGARDARSLVETVKRFQWALGDAPYLFSAGATARQLVAHTKRREPIGPSEPEPDVPLAVVDSAYRIARPGWVRAMHGDECAKGWIRAFDRRGSYLAAWPGILGAGPWAHRTSFSFDSRAPLPGYWRVERYRLPSLDHFPNPFARVVDRPGAPASPSVWLTEPLMTLACELRGDMTMPVLEAWTQERKGRYLEPAYERLRSARANLSGGHDDEALAVLKVGYAAATAWLEWGPEAPHEYARPVWRRTIVDRFVANTIRSLLSAASHAVPFAWTDIDTVLYAVDDPDEIPDGLATNPARLGSWRPGRAWNLSDLLDEPATEHAALGLSREHVSALIEAMRR